VKVPKTSEMKDSKFLKQTDIGTGSLMTVESIDQHNVAKEGADREMKWCMTFAEADKPLVLNATNIALCERIFGSDDTDHWVGKKIVLYTDPTVSYGGKIVGGIRVRAPKIRPVPVAVVVPVPAPVAAAEPFDDDDSIPF
jgi:hypothetical protein